MNRSPINGMMISEYIFSSDLYTVLFIPKHEAEVPKPSNSPVLRITAIVQSSSATTVMVVGFVNAGLMNLAQAMTVIMGANIGTTATG